jgi:hypothetical protein
MYKSNIKENLPHLKIKDEKILKLDLINSFKEAELNNISGSENNNIEINYKLNDVQVYWINKINIIIKDNNLHIILEYILIFSI